MIDEEWPATKSGNRSRLVGVRVNSFQGDLKQLNPRTEVQKAAFLQLLAQQDTRTDGRLERLSQANRSIPTPVWFLLGFGAFVTIGFAFFFADRREGFIVQGSLIAAIAAPVIWILPVWFLDHPYEEQQRQHHAGRDGAAARDRRARAQGRRAAVRR